MRGGGLDLTSSKPEKLSLQKGPAQWFRHCEAKRSGERVVSLMIVNPLIQANPLRIFSDPVR